MLSSLMFITSTALASATGYSFTAYAPGTNIDGALFHAAGLSFFTGMSGPATYCPGTFQAPGPCPDVGTTLVEAGMTAMHVEVPGGQRIYIRPDGQVKYSVPHSNYVPNGSFVGGWYTKTIISDCAPTTDVLDFYATTADSSFGGIMLCRDVPDFMVGSGASHQLYVKTPAFNLTNCSPALGLKLKAQPDQWGPWQYL